MARLAASKPDNAAIAELLDRFKDAASMIESGDVAGYQDLCSDMDQEIARMAGNSRMQTVLRTVWQDATGPGHRAVQPEPSPGDGG